MPQETACQEIEKSNLTSKKSLINSSSKLLTQTRDGNATGPRSKKAVADPFDKKKLSEKQLNKSIHFSSHIVGSNTTTSAAAEKFRNTRISTTALNVSKNSSTPLKTINKVCTFITHISSILLSFIHHV